MSVDQARLWALVLAATVPTAVVAVCYLRGLRRVLRHPQGRRRHLRRAWAAGAGVLTVVVICSPPVGARLEQRLSTHMVQHLVLIMISAPLLAYASPGQPLLAGVPTAVRRRMVRLGRRLPVGVLLTPHLAWGAHIAALWLWHLPTAYDAAVRSESLHLVEHACFLSTAWLFWWHLATLTRHRLRGVPAALYLLAAIPPGAALGAVLTFPNHPLYPLQARHAAQTGTDPLLDQRIGGLVMWIPLDFAYLAVVVWLLARWLRSMALRWPEPEHDPALVDGPAPGAPR